MEGKAGDDRDFGKGKVANTVKSNLIKYLGYKYGTEGALGDGEGSLNAITYKRTARGSFNPLTWCLVRLFYSDAFIRK